MISKVSQYYQTFLNRIAPDQDNYPQENFFKHVSNGSIITGYGTFVYHMNNNSFYGIIDENNNKFLPINATEYQSLLKSRKRVQFCLQVYPEVSNIYRWGKTSRLIAVQLLQ